MASQYADKFFRSTITICTADFENGGYYFFLRAIYILGPLETTQEMAHYVVCPNQKK